jgi:hypothetical protein
MIKYRSVQDSINKILKIAWLSYLESTVNVDEGYGPTSFVDLSEKILRGGDENGRGCNELLARTEIFQFQVQSTTPYKLL